MSVDCVRGSTCCHASASAVRFVLRAARGRVAGWQCGNDPDRRSERGVAVTRSRSRFGASCPARAWARVAQQNISCEQLSTRTTGSLPLFSSIRVERSLAYNSDNLARSLARSVSDGVEEGCRSSGLRLGQRYVSTGSGVTDTKP